MTKLKKKITNPMTVIAIFATLSEASATVALPFLDDKEREVYIWFLISFPFYLIFLFFITLNFNYRSLYAPSDFEKGKHFIKVMDNSKRSKNNAPKLSSESYPRRTSTSDRRSAYVRLPVRLKDLYIIDGRWMSEKVEFSYLMEKIQKEREKPAHVIVFVTCVESEILLRESALRHSKRAKKHSGFCIAYNLSSHSVTIIDQYLPTDTQQSVALEDQPERTGQEGINRH